VHKAGKVHVTVRRVRVTIIAVGGGKRILSADFVALVILNATRMRRIILPPVVCPGVLYFSTLSHKWGEFRGGGRGGGVTEHEMCVLIFSTIFCLKYFSL